LRAQESLRDPPPSELRAQAEAVKLLRSQFP
jgi:hypothetical protein